VGHVAVTAMQLVLKLLGPRVALRVWGLWTGHWRNGEVTTSHVGRVGAGHYRRGKDAVILQPRYHDLVFHPWAKAQ
jgi:hypothetical protein